MNAISKRLPRFVRHRFGKPLFVLQARDRNIVRLVAEHRVIASDDICLLVGGSEQNVLRRLQRLFHSGFVDRPGAQREFGNARLLYTLGARGADLIAQETGHRPTGDWAEKNRSLHSPYLEHALMVSRFHTALRHACAARGVVLVERWHGDGFLRDSVWAENNGRRARLPVVPDALCILRILEGAKAGRIHMFLEADRSTMTTRRFVAKMSAYLAYGRSGRAEERLGAKNFLIVVATKSTARMDSLMTAAARSLDQRSLRPFVFAPQDEYLPASRLAILSPLWRTPADSMRHSLLE